jgi:hypothetical protein
VIAIALTLDERYNNHMDRAQAHSANARLFPHRFEMWQTNSLSTQAAAALAGCDTVEEIARLGHVHPEILPSLDEKSLQQLADLTGWPPKRRTAVDTIAASPAPGMDAEEGRKTATDVLTSLRKAGFVLAVSNRAVA